MTRVDIGEVLIKGEIKGLLSDKKTTFKLTPSFENMLKLGDSEDIMRIYATLFNNKHINILKSFKNNINKSAINAIKDNINNQSDAADKVIQSCCDKEFTLNLKLDIKISIACSLIQHGIVGLAKVRVSQRNQTKGYRKDIDINQYINIARVHLGISFDEAKNLTMTEYIMLMATKYPDNQGFTAQEYDDVMAAHRKQKAERIKLEELNKSKGS